MQYKTAQDVTIKSAELIKYWFQRNQAFKTWYTILDLSYLKKQKGIEVIESNEPRTFFNLAVYFLTANPIQHKVYVDNPDETQPQALTKLSRGLKRMWRDVETPQQVGRDPWLAELVKFFLMTGWITVFDTVDTDKKVKSEVWNPAEVFPEFGSKQLNVCVHKYTISKEEANNLITMMEWKEPSSPYKGNVTVYDFFEFDGAGVFHSVVFNTDFALPPEDVTDIVNGAIPIFIRLAGGIPDRGAISTGDVWKKKIGESIFVTNEEEYRNYNRQLSFLQQVVRQSAQPKYAEHVKTAKTVATATNIDQYGTILQYGEGEGIDPILTPPIPAEYQALLLSTEGRIQRGAFPYLLYGYVTGALSGFAINQLIAAAYTVLNPYHQAIMSLIAAVDTVRLSLVKNNNIDLAGIKGSDIPDDFYVDARYKLATPSDIIQRANAARLLTGEQDILSLNTVLDEIVGVESPETEIAQIARSIAMRHPTVRQIELITALRAQAEYMRQTKNQKSAQLFDRAAGLMEQQLTGVQPTGAQPAGRQALGPRVRQGGGVRGIIPEVQPPELAGQGEQAVQGEQGVAL